MHLVSELLEEQDKAATIDNWRRLMPRNDKWKWELMAAVSILFNIEPPAKGEERQWLADNVIEGVHMKHLLWQTICGHTVDLNINTLGKVWSQPQPPEGEAKWVILRCDITDEHTHEVSTNYVRAEVTDDRDNPIIPYSDDPTWNSMARDTVKRILAADPPRWKFCAVQAYWTATSERQADPSQSQ